MVSFPQGVDAGVELLGRLVTLFHSEELPDCLPKWPQPFMSPASPAVDEARLLMTEEAPRMPLGSSVTKLLLRSPWCPRVCWGVCVSGCVCMLACVCWGVCMFWGVCVASAGISSPVSASLSWGPLMMGLALCTCPLHGAELAHGEARALRVKWRNLSGDTASHLRAGASQVGGVIEGLAVPDGAGHLAEFSCLIVTMTPVTPKMLTVASCSRGAAAKPCSISWPCHALAASSLWEPELRAVSALMAWRI